MSEPNENTKPIPVFSPWMSIRKVSEIKQHVRMSSRRRSCHQKDFKQHNKLNVHSFFFFFFYTCQMLLLEVETTYLPAGSQLWQAAAVSRTVNKQSWKCLLKRFCLSADLWHSWSRVHFIVWNSRLGRAGERAHLSDVLVVLVRRSDISLWCVQP